MTWEKIEHLNSESITHIGNDTENPFARIACRARTLSPTLCDGTCWNCKKERARYREDALETIIRLHNTNPNTGDGPEHESGFLSRQEAEAILEERLERILEAKRRAIAQAKELEWRVNVRLGEIMKAIPQSERHPTAVQLH